MNLDHLEKNKAISFALDFIAPLGGMELFGILDTSQKRKCVK